jgi:hypothetical protein
MLVESHDFPLSPTNFGDHWDHPEIFWLRGFVHSSTCTDRNPRNQRNQKADLRGWAAGYVVNPTTNHPQYT